MVTVNTLYEGGGGGRIIRYAQSQISGSVPLSYVVDSNAERGVLTALSCYLLQPQRPLSSCSVVQFGYFLFCWPPDVLETTPILTIFALFIVSVRNSSCSPYLF